MGLLDVQAELSDRLSIAAILIFGLAGAVLQAFRHLHKAKSAT